MASIRRALALSFAGKYSSLAIHFGATLVLARLLTPAEIGVYSVAAAAVALAHVVREFGVGSYLIQERELTEDRIRTAFGVALVIGWTMAAVLFGLSGPLARFYDEPGLQRVLWVLCVNFLLVPINSPALALLRRDMAFGALYVVNVAGAAAHVATGIALAALGYGFMSLAWASVAGTAAITLLAAVYRPRIARVLPSLREWRRIARFGGLSSAASLIAQIGMNATDLVLGRVLGFAAVGIYSRAHGLIALFNRDLMGAVHSVAFPVFATEHRSGRDLKQAYLRGVTLVTAFAWPFFGFLGLLAYPIVRILFGAQWDASVPLVQILCLAASVYASHSLIGNLLLASGQVRKNLNKELIIQPARVILVTISAFHSLEAVATSMIIVHSISFAVALHYASQLFGISLRDIGKCIQKSMKVTAVALVVPVTVVITMDIQPTNVVAPFLLAAIGSAIGWFTGIFFFDHPLQSELRIFLRKASLIARSPWPNPRP